MKNVVRHLNINILLLSVEERFFAPSYSSYEVLKQALQAVEESHAIQHCMFSAVPLVCTVRSLGLCVHLHLLIGSVKEG